MLPSKSTDTPFLARPDTLEIQQAEHPFSFRNSEDKDLNALIVEAINRMGGVGDDAEENYRRALNSLTKRGPGVLDVIAAEYEDLPEDCYLDRWSLVQLVVELRYPEAVKPLNRIIAARIPAEKLRKSHDMSTVAEEVMIRTTAVEGLVRLSADGVAEARELLLKHAAHRTFSIRRACVQGLMETGSDEDKRKLRRLLKARDEEGLLKIKRADVRRVPQPIGGRFVVPADLKSDAPPPDLGATKE
jgi:HEAT repeat protein